MVISQCIIMKHGGLVELFRALFAVWINSYTITRVLNQSVRVFGFKSFEQSKALDIAL